LPCTSGAWQKAFDPLLTPGARNYWKSHNFSALNDAAIDTVIRYAGNLPGPQCEIFLGLIGGQASRVAADATAYANRDTLYAMNVHARWSDPAEDAKCIGWAREFFDAAARQQHLQHYRAAVALQFQHIFAGIRMGRLEKERQALIDDAAISLGEGQIGRMARL
jgi:hypothetical protein